MCAVPPCVSASEADVASGDLKAGLASSSGSSRLSLSALEPHLVDGFSTTYSGRSHSSYPFNLLSQWEISLRGPNCRLPKGSDYHSRWLRAQTLIKSLQDHFGPRNREQGHTFTTKKFNGTVNSGLGTQEWQGQCYSSPHQGMKLGEKRPGGDV